MSVNKNLPVQCEDEEPNPYCHCPRCESAKTKAATEAMSLVAMGEFVQRHGCLYTEISFPIAEN